MALPEGITNDPEGYFRSDHEKITKVGFGAVVVDSYTLPTRADTLKKTIVLDVNEVGSISTHGIKVDEEGKEYIIPLGGSASYKDIIEILEFWDYETILRALRRGHELAGSKLSKKSEGELKKYSQRPPYTIKE